MQKGLQLFHIVPIYVRAQGKRRKGFFPGKPVKSITESPIKINSVILDSARGNGKTDRDKKYIYFYCI